MGWIGPAIAAVGSLVSSGVSASNNAATNASNANLNQANMDWQTQMSDTAMQRRVADLKTAGLNPLLAVGQGGASTPGFSPIAMQQQGAGVSQGIQSAAQVVAQKAQIDNTNADTRNKNANAAMTEATTPDNSADPGSPRGLSATMLAANAQQAVNQTGMQRLTMDQLRAQTSNLGAQGDEIRARIDNLVAQNPGITADSQMSELQAGARQQLQADIVRASLAAARSQTGSAQAQSSFNDSIWGRVAHAVGGGPGGDSGVTNAVKVFDAASGH